MSGLLDILCVALSAVFFWSTFVVLAGLLRPAKARPSCGPKLRFAVLICARNEADYADEQPVTMATMWRQLRRWTTGGWQVVYRYFRPWFVTILRRPSLVAILSFPVFSLIHSASVIGTLFFPARCWKPIAHTGG